MYLTISPSFNLFMNLIFFSSSIYLIMPTIIILIIMIYGLFWWAVARPSFFVQSPGAKWHHWLVHHVLPVHEEVWQEPGGGQSRIGGWHVSGCKGVRLSRLTGWLIQQHLCSDGSHCSCCKVPRPTAYLKLRNRILEALIKSNIIYISPINSSQLQRSYALLCWIFYCLYALLSLYVPSMSMQQ